MKPLRGKHYFRRGQDLLGNFWKHAIVTPDGCWKWNGRTRFGYGRLSLRRPDGVHTCLAAHRFSWEIHRGPIPEGMQVLHSCDNPPCTNPEHLFLGTDLDNKRDAIRKGRWDPRRFNQPKGQKHPWAKLSEQQVLLARDLASKRIRSISSMAREFGVHPVTLWRAVNGEHWKCLNP